MQGWFPIWTQLLTEVVCRHPVSSAGSSDYVLIMNHLSVSHLEPGRTPTLRRPLQLSKYFEIIRKLDELLHFLQTPLCVPKSRVVHNSRGRTGTEEVDDCGVFRGWRCAGRSGYVLI